MSTTLLVLLIASVSIIALIYLMIVLLSTGSSSKRELQISKKDILEQANLLFKQKKYKLVEKLARTYLEVKPEHHKLRLVLAKTLYTIDNIYDAIKEGMVITNADDTNIEARLLLAKCYKKINQYAKAITELQEVLKNDADNIIAVKDLSEIYLETKQKVSSLKILKKLESLTDNNHELMQIKTTLADINIELENYPEAFDELNQILQIYPEDTETHKKLIELYIKVQNYDSAITDCEELLEVNENNSLSLWLLNNLINLCYLEKDVDKTMVYAQKLLEHPFSDKTKTRTYIAKILIASGKEEEGMALLTELSERNKENIEIKRLMIQTYENRNSYSSAIDLYREIVDLVNPLEVKDVHTEMSNCFVKWAKYLFEKNDMNECFKVFTLAMQYDNTNPEVYYELGQANAFIKNYNEAILQIKKAIHINPKCAKYYMAIADAYEQIGNTYEQKDALLVASEVDEENTEVLYQLAILYEHQNDKTSEIKILEKILEINPAHIDAKYLLALLLERQGNKEEALKLYKEIESVDLNYKNIRENIQMLTIEGESQGL